MQGVEVGSAEEDDLDIGIVLAFDLLSGALGEGGGAIRTVSWQHTNSPVERRYVSRNCIRKPGVSLPMPREPLRGAPARCEGSNWRGSTG